jgi:hypothetical protein
MNKKKKEENKNCTNSNVLTFKINIKSSKKFGKKDSNRREVLHFSDAILPEGKN